ncbi:DDE-type integrase/transposase/recombinase [Shimia aestuarii]|uniref:DDE-type integrase/transposase/recombinase n=1 Tax=Shimia aestuarii TaxID=254406 RepID=UPI000B8A5815|nr:DDE-type integrase/transposase/recombinase [Shimia aestuarii]
MRAHSNWGSQLDAMSVEMSGQRHHTWRGVIHEGEFLECYVTKTRDKKAALKFLKISMRRFGRPEVIVTDRLRYYGAAMKEIGTRVGSKPAQAETSSNGSGCTVLESLCLGRIVGLG